MNSKTIFTIIIAAIFIAAMVIYPEQSLPELISYFVGAAGIISAVWNWFKKNEIVEKYWDLEEENFDLKIKSSELEDKLSILEKKISKNEN